MSNPFARIAARQDNCPVFLRDGAWGFPYGPVYGGRQIDALEAAEKAGLFFPYSIGIDMKFHSESPLDLTEAEIKAAITQQVAEVAARTSICWWYLKPEELRYWRKREMTYLKAAAEAIHAADPLKRPVWMYEPNHRSAKSLVQTGAHLDLIGKGSYVNYAGMKTAACGCDAVVSGFPKECRIEEADTGGNISSEDAGEFDLPAWGVRSLKFTR